MAFMGRGDMSPFDDDIGGIQDNNVGSHRYWHWHYITYIPLNNTYVIMQMLITFLILIVGLITFLLTYKSTIIDPIESTKKIFINTHLALIGILLATTLLINFFSKSATSLIKSLAIILIISITIMLIFFGYKLSLDSTYTKNKFEQIYTEQNIGKTSDNKSKIDIGITGISIKTQQEYYIDECLKLYNIFKTKTYATIGVHLLLNILLIYQISKILKVQGKKDRLNKDDLILFDEEKNIKI